MYTLPPSSPWCFVFGLDTCLSPTGGQVAGRRGDWSCCCRRIPQSAPKGLFLFEKILLLTPGTPYKEWPVLSHSPPLQLDRDCLGQGPTWPNFQLSPASAQGLCGLTSLSLFPFLRLQAIRSLLVLLKPCLAGEGAINWALSQESYCRPGGRGSGAAAAQVPVLVPGAFLS